MSDFRLIEESSVHRGYAIEVVVGSFEGPKGERFTRDIVRAKGAVAVVAVDERDDGLSVVLVRQYRGALDTWLLEIPAGLRDKVGEDPVETAARELAEEAGLAAQRYELLTVFANAAGMTDHQTYVFLATGLSDVPNAADGVEEEYLEILRFPLANVPAAIASGELRDAKTVLGLLLACRQYGI